ncbi:MAG TPA: MgtC/SapB family protein [Bacteroidales bacterium]|jgi:putative Mg2+ transporter-C (MgtC) family protein|nr:MgtC/SapB family protein [Bacteroidales bacterium]HOS58320.1 MgtC/SapB family protein [Bacteroidales bacterium]HRR04976.1 MgtC/SapB family protein [Bacteroidales bacterium]HRT14079.1 MgtC/SapB family protein [Bacteroidales bacterium]
MNMVEIFEVFEKALHSMEVTSLSAAIKLVISFLLGSVIGIERQTRRQSAGLRTFALICIASTAAMLLSIWIPQNYLHFHNGDPGRIAAQILTGIGFLGAGAIIQSRGSVYGLTTAASIWVVAIIGMCVGAGFYFPAVILTFLSLFVLLVLERLDKRRATSGEVKLLTIHFEICNPDIESIKKILKETSVYLFNFSIKKDFKNQHSSIILKVQISNRTSIDTLFDKIHQLENVTQVNLEVA